MLILHEYRTGAQFSIWPNDIRYSENHNGFTVLIHTIPHQGQPVMADTPLGRREILPPPQVVLKFTEVIESLEEIQTMIVRLRALERGAFDWVSGPKPVVCSRTEEIASITRQATSGAFGNGPREDIAAKLAVGEG